MNGALIAAGVLGVIVAESALGWRAPRDDAPRVDSSTGERNLDAFLRLIRVAESADNYRALVGGGEFDSFGGHPYYTEGFRGVPVGNGLRSFAAGAYQITRDTFNWLTTRRGFDPGDFGPDAQDEMAVALIDRAGALDDVKAGRFGAALSKLRNEWEAFTKARWAPERAIPLIVSFGGTWDENAQA